MTRCEVELMCCHTHLSTTHRSIDKISCIELKNQRRTSDTIILHQSLEFHNNSNPIVQYLHNRAHLKALNPPLHTPLKSPVKQLSEIMKAGNGGRIEQAFAAAKEKGEAAFVAFVTAGYPHAEGMLNLIPLKPY